MRIQYSESLKSALEEEATSSAEALVAFDLFWSRYEDKSESESEFDDLVFHAEAFVRALVKLDHSRKKLVDCLGQAAQSE